jgi:hypothetical protein
MSEATARKERETARQDKAVALMKHLRGDIPDPENYLRGMCRLLGVKWESLAASADQMCSGTADGALIVVTRKEWMPLDGDAGADLLGRKLKEALP